MKFLIIFALRIFKSMFVIPWIFFSLTCKSIIDSFLEIYTMTMEQFSDVLDPIIKTIRCVLCKVISTVK